LAYFSEGVPSRKRISDIKRFGYFDNSGVGILSKVMGVEIKPLAKLLIRTFMALLWIEPIDVLSYCKWNVPFRD